MKRIGGNDLLFLEEELLATDSCWPIFFKEYSHWEVEHAPVEGHTPTDMSAAQIGLDGWRKKKGHKVGWIGKGHGVGL